MDFSYSNSTAMRAAVGVLLPCTFIPFFVRLFVRSTKKVPFQLDDYFIIPAAALTFGVFIATGVGVNDGGMGRRGGPLDDFESPEQEATFLRCLNAIQTLSCLALGCIRLSLYFSYVRGRGWSLRDLKLTWGYWILIAMSALWSVAYFVLYLALPPSPVSESGSSRASVFQIAIGYAASGPREAFVYGLWIADAILNFITIFTAIPNLAKSTSNTSKRMAIYKAGVVTVGVGALAASIMRPVTCSDWLSERNNGPNWDDILATSALVLWSLIECSLGNIAACLTILTSPSFEPDDKPSVNFDTGLFSFRR